MRVWPEVVEWGSFLHRFVAARGRQRDSELKTQYMDASNGGLS